MLFDGKDLSHWQSEGGGEAKWKVESGYMEAAGGKGVQTKDGFGDMQLHVEFATPEKVVGEGQGRGNSGVFLGGWGKGDEGYEIQVLDSYNNKTYVNGQAGSIYKQHAPLVNPNRAPGEWNVYDIVWTAPRFNADGTLKSPARITAFLNGVLVQNNVEVQGTTVYIGKPAYKAHGPLPIKLQDHGDPSEPISFRNIWVRPL
ncbi:MAG: 3-keto-disaccharide hydrolase [Chitinophagaceae bacterium]